MDTNFFNKIHNKLSAAGIQERTKEAREWFLKRLRDIRNISRETLLKDRSLEKRKKPKIGKMFMFFYDPKTKEKLPFYDTFPLIIMVGPAKDGFYGLNLHYLAPRVRAVFFDRLMDHLNNDAYDETTKFKVAYSMLKKTATLRQFAPCFKHYLFSHVCSHTVEVPPAQWEIALFLPTESFEKMHRVDIWRQTKIK